MTNETLSNDSDQSSISQPPASETDQEAVSPADETTSQPITKIIPHDHHLGEN